MALNRPWFKKFPRDWIGNAAVRRLSLPARGLLADLECLMQDARPVGHLLINGSKVNEDQLARILGVQSDVLRELIPELIEAGILKMTRAKVLYDPQMIAQDSAAQKGREAVDKRWQARDAARYEGDNPEINGRKPAPREVTQVTENAMKSRRPNRSPNRSPITHSHSHSHIANNIDLTLPPRAQPPDGDDEPFPERDTIAFSEPWRSIAKASGKGIDIDLLANAFRSWLRKAKIPFNARGMPQKFKSFCEKHRVN